MTEEPDPQQEDAFVLWDDCSYNSDDDGEINEPFSWWRMPPEESRSDWTIELSEDSTSGEEKDTFHVHQYILSLGPNHSKYFKCLFLGSNSAESETKTSKIVLPSIAVDAFPCMLDFLYSGENGGGKLPIITTENATALHFLGQYFGITGLCSEAAAFFKDDMCMDNVTTYYEDAKLVGDEKILKTVAKKCCEALQEIGLDSALMENSDVALWRNIAHLIGNGGGSGPTDGDSKYLSRLVAKFCELHSGLVDAATFVHLTDSTHMPEIDKDAAVPLLRLEGSILPESLTSDVFSDLQLRCIGALAKAWRSIDGASLQQDLSGLNPNLFSSVVTKGFKEAKKEIPADWVATKVVVCKWPRSGSDGALP